MRYVVHAVRDGLRPNRAFKIFRYEDTDGCLVWEARFHVGGFPHYACVRDWPGQDKLTARDLLQYARSVRQHALANPSPAQTSR